MADLDSRVATVAISRLPHQVLLWLKCWLAPPVTRAAPIEANGLVLPGGVGESIDGACRVLCLGPAEWLMLAEPGSMTGAGLQMLQHEVALQGVALIDASHGLSGFTLQGPAAREVLCRGCGIDLHPTLFPAGRCVRTRLAQIPAVIVHRKHIDGYELYVARSHATYLSGWLDDAALEWAAPAR